MKKSPSKYSKVLPVKLTPAELETKGQDLADLCKEINRKKDAAKLEAKLAKDEIDGLETSRARLATVVKDRAEERAVECEDRYDFPGRRIISVRLDTGEVVGERAIPLHEFQEEMDLHASPVDTTPVETSKPSEALPPETVAEENNPTTDEPAKAPEDPFEASDLPFPDAKTTSGKVTRFTRRRAAGEG